MIVPVLRQYAKGSVIDLPNSICQHTSILAARYCSGAQTEWPAPVPETRAMSGQAALRVKLSVIVTVVTVCVMSVLGILVMRNVQDTAEDQSIGALRDQNRLIADLLASIGEVLKPEAAAKSGNLVGAEARIWAIEG